MLKPGVNTSEFLLTLLVDLGAVAASVAGVLPPKWATVASAVSTGAYALSRGWAKSSGAGSGPAGTGV